MMTVTIRCSVCGAKITEDVRIGWSIAAILTMHEWREVGGRYYCQKCLAEWES